LRATKILAGATVVLLILWLVLTGTCSCNMNDMPRTAMVTDSNGSGNGDYGEEEDYCKYLDNEVCVPPPFMQDTTPGVDTKTEEDNNTPPGLDTNIWDDTGIEVDTEPGGPGPVVEDDLWDAVDCGEAPTGSYFVVIASDLSFRQEVTYMKAGQEFEKTVDMVAGEPVCILITPDDEPTVLAITLVCEEDAECPDPELQTPQLYVRTDPATDILFYFGNEVDKDLHELFCNPYMFEEAEGLGPLYQDGFGFLIYTSWIGP